MVPFSITSPTRCSHSDQAAHDVRLKWLNLERMDLHMLRFDLLWCYKLVSRLVRMDRAAFFELRPSSTRGHPYKLFKRHCTNTVWSVLFVRPT